MPCLAGAGKVWALALSIDAELLTAICRGSRLLPWLTLHHWTVLRKIELPVPDKSTQGPGH